jgi:hypothetical protein
MQPTVLLRGTLCSGACKRLAGSREVDRGLGEWLASLLQLEPRRRRTNQEHPEQPHSLIFHLSGEFLVAAATKAVAKGRGSRTTCHPRGTRPEDFVSPALLQCWLVHWTRPPLWKRRKPALGSQPGVSSSCSSCYWCLHLTSRP